MRILFTDDQIDTLKLYELALTLRGHSVCTCMDAPGALAAVKAEQFDVIVCDGEMPGMSGWEAVRRIRDLPYGADVPIVIYTAYHTQRDLSIAHAVGANELFTKPIMPDEMNQRLEGIYAARRDEFKAKN